MTRIFVALVLAAILAPASALGQSVVVSHSVDVKNLLSCATTNSVLQGGTTPACTATPTVTGLTADTLTLDTANKDTKLVRDAANTLAMKNGIVDQAFRVYGTGGYAEFKDLAGDTQIIAPVGGALRFGAQTQQWVVNNAGHLGVLAANTFDIGSAGAPVRSIYSGTSVNIGATSFQASVPAISSGFGTGASVTMGTATAFRVNVGTGGLASSGVVAMNATATNAWNCHVNNLTAAAGHRADNTRQTANTTTTVTVENQTTSTGAAVAWAASDVLTLNCTAL